MRRLQIIFPDDLADKLDAHCKKYSYERSEYIRALVRTKLFAATPSSAGTPNTEGGQLPHMTKVDPGKVNVPLTGPFPDRFDSDHQVLAT